MIKEDQIVYTYLHLAAAKELTGTYKYKKYKYCMKQSQMIMGDLCCTVSAVAGRMSVQAGAHCLEKIKKVEEYY